MTNEPPQLESLSLRVLTVRSQDPNGFGGCIFTGQVVNSAGDITNANAVYTVKAPWNQLGQPRVEKGQWWAVDGELERYEQVINGYRRTEWQVLPYQMQLLRPSGEHIVTLIAESSAFVGIGEVKARKLWDSFGERLYALLDEGDVQTLCSVLKPGVAAAAVAAWGEYGDSRTLQWLQQHGFDIDLGRKLLKHFGKETIEMIENDPYRLLSFCASWKRVDALARYHFMLTEGDPRRLQGAIEEAIYRLFNDHHTMADFGMVLRRLETLIGDSLELAQEALTEGISNGSYVFNEITGGIHALGPLLMEREVAQAIAGRLTCEHWERYGVLLPDQQVKQIILRYEQYQRIKQRIDDFSLNAEQRLAVSTAASNAFMVLTGGAGVGKTTVLDALYQVYDAANIQICQMALSGRAAKRMQETTGRKAKTIASFLKDGWDEDDDQIYAGQVVVIDEASMVDIITMYRLVQSLPPECRLVLVGDAEQLPPVGPGLVLHTLVGMQGIPQVELVQTRRFGGGIATAATAIRNGTWPELSANIAHDIAMIRCEPGEINGHVLSLLDRGDALAQVLSSTRNSPYGGCKLLNQQCQQRYAADSVRLTVWDNDEGQRLDTGLRLGEPLLCTRNMWDWDLQNGALGRLVHIEDTPRRITIWKKVRVKSEDGERRFQWKLIEAGHAIAWAEWDDDVCRPITEEMLDDLELAYSITVHKSQGSQFPRIIVPVTGNRLLDRTLIYTAVTRAQGQVILVGDEEAARKAVEAPPKATQRMVGLGKLLQALLQQEAA